jgi:hypothetical protein
MLPQQLIPMLALQDDYTGLAGVGVYVPPVTPINADSLEWTPRKNHLHTTAPVNRLHYTVKRNGTR